MSQLPKQGQYISGGEVDGWISARCLEASRAWFYFVGWD